MLIPFFIWAWIFYGLRSDLPLILIVFFIIAVPIISYFYLKKKFFVNLFSVVFALCLFFVHQQFDENEKFQTDQLPRKGFVSLRLKVTGFPELNKAEETIQYKLKADPVTVYYEGRHPPAPYSDILVRGKLYQNKWNGRIFMSLYADELIMEKNGPFIFRLINQVRNRIEQRIIQRTGQQQLRGLYLSMILGNRNFLSYQTSQSFKMAGISHLLALSGLHIGLISMFFYTLLNLFLNTKKSGFIVSFMIFLYVLIAGFPPSLMRAGLMFFLFFVNEAAGRQTEWFDVLLISALIVLSVQPGLITSAGFLLSYSAVTGIYFFHPVFISLFSFTKRFPYGEEIASNLSVTLSATVATMPAVIIFFHQFSLISPLSNLLIVPLFEITAIALFLNFFLMIIGIPFLPELMNQLLCLIWGFQSGMADLLSLIPFALIEISSADKFILIGGLIFLLFIIRTGYLKYQFRKQVLTTTDFR